MEIGTFKSMYSSMTVPICCPCGSNISLPIRPRERFDIPIKLGICLRCGHLYAKSVLNEVALDEFYSSLLYRNLYGNLSVQDHIDKLHVAERTETQLYKIAKPYLPNNGGSVLEWGSSGGWNLLPFRDFGHSVLGLDVNAEYLDAGRHTYNLDLKLINEKTITEIETRHFDIVILNHVLEHLVDPQHLLKNLVQISSANTVFLIGLPTIEVVKEYGFRRYFTVAHIHYFSKFSFKSMLRRSGMRLIETHRTNGGLTFVAKKDDTPINTSDFRGVIYALFSITANYLKFRVPNAALSFIKMSGLYRPLQSFYKILQQ